MLKLGTFVTDSASGIKIIHKCTLDVVSLSVTPNVDSNIKTIRKQIINQNDHSLNDTAINDEVNVLSKQVLKYSNKDLNVTPKDLGRFGCDGKYRM